MNNNEQKATYGFLIDSLENNLNQRNTDIKQVKECILSLKSLYNVEISREFLRNLIKGTEEQKSHKLYYALKELSFNKFGFRYSQELDFTKYPVEVVEYSINNGIITTKTTTTTIGREVLRHSRKAFHFLA